MRAVRDGLIWLALGLTAWAPAHAWATEVVIPAVVDGSGAFVPAALDVRLITQNGKPAIGFGPVALATEYRAVALPVDGLTLSLAPQSAIHIPGGADTYYQISIRTANAGQSYRVQVPESAEAQQLVDLVGAEVAP